MSTTRQRDLTAQDLEAMRDEKYYELVDGKLLENKMGAESCWIAGILFRLLDDYCRANRLGWVFVENAYDCFPGVRNRVRRPDVSFVRAGRIPGERLPKGYLKIAPDLAVEVISPRDLVDDVDKKLNHLLGGGVRLIWVVNPGIREVRVYRPDGAIIRLREDDKLDGEDVIPGFRCKVADLLPSPPSAETPGR